MASVLIAGGSGLIGTRLSQLLTLEGMQVYHLSRKKQPNSIYPTFRWNIEKGHIEKKAFDTKIDYIINLSGAGIADHLWTNKRKEVLINSRVHSTKLLAQYIQDSTYSPKAYIGAAAIGIYGNRGHELLTEESSIGKKGFLVECCTVWEKAINTLADKTEVRKVIFRIGIVLSTKGGALPKMLFPLKFFTANYFGNGQQWYAWIHIDDLCNIFSSAIKNENMAGIYNAVAPIPLTNKELVKKMLQSLSKRAILIPIPQISLRLSMGEMSDVLLNSNKVIPERLQSINFPFRFPTFETAVKDVIKRKI